MRIRIDYIQDAGAPITLHEHLDGTIWKFEHLQQISDTTYAVKVFWRRVILSSRPLSHQQDTLAGFHRSL
ncbi:MAG: hypothetical protein JW384_03924 [Nitrosomonadaceae bacterium]|nr:hypothetical protein [Nitrosomonadaceae bacterium]